jgi:hypothetical protein
MGFKDMTSERQGRLLRVPKILMGSLRVESALLLMRI